MSGKGIGGVAAPSARLPAGGIATQSVVSPTSAYNNAPSTIPGSVSRPLDLSASKRLSLISPVHSGTSPSMNLGNTSLVGPGPQTLGIASSRPSARPMASSCIRPMAHLASTSPAASLVALGTQGSSQQSPSG